MMKNDSARLCPLTKGACGENCAWYDTQTGHCAGLLMAKTLVRIQSDTEVSSAALNNIGLNTEYLDR